VVELVDTLVLGTSAARCVGSSPTIGTSKMKRSFTMNPLYDRLKDKVYERIYNAEIGEFLSRESFIISSLSKRQHNRSMQALNDIFQNAVVDGFLRKMPPEHSYCVDWRRTYWKVIKLPQ